MYPLIPLQNHSQVYGTTPHLNRVLNMQASHPWHRQTLWLVCSLPWHRQSCSTVCATLLVQREPLVCAYSTPSTDRAVTQHIPCPWPKTELLVLLGVPSHRSQDHAANVQPEGPKAPSHLRDWRYSNACQKALSPHRVTHQRNCALAPASPKKQITKGPEPEKQITEGPEQWENKVKLRAVTIKV